MSELLRRLDTPVDNFVDQEVIKSTTGFDHFYVDLENHGFSQRPVVRWMCTDTQVGMNVIYYNDEPICVTNQTARKNPTDIEWVSEDIFLKIQKIIWNLIPDEDKPNKPDILDLEQEFSRSGIPCHQVSFTNQMMTKEVIFEGQRYKVKPWYPIKRDYLDKEIQIEKDGEIKVVNLREVLIPIQLKDE